MVRGTSSPKCVSVIVPLWNEEGGVEYLRERLGRLQRVFGNAARLECIFVNDGSTDRTASFLETVFGQQPGCQIVTHERNRGLGAALRTGFQHATGDVICTIDGDCSYEPEGLKDLVDSLELNHASIATASPYHPLGSVEGAGRFRIRLSRACSLMYRLISPAKLHTYTSVFRAYSREAAKTVRFDSNRFLCPAEIVLRAAEQGHRVVEVPMTLRARKVGQSKMKVIPTIFAHLSLMASTVWRRGKSRVSLLVERALSLTREGA